MINFLKKVLTFITFTFLLFVFVTNSNLVISSVNTSINLFLYKLVPTLFPFFILIDILNNYNYTYFISKYLKIKYIDVLIVSIFSGLSSNAKYIENLLDKNSICKKDSEILLSFTFFPGIMFVLGLVSNLINSKTDATIILLIIYLSNLIVYLFNYNKLSNKNLYNINKTKALFVCIKDSVFKNTLNMCIIFGTVVTFNIIISIVSYYFNFNNVILGIINIFLELTSGANIVSALSIDRTLKLIIITTGISFSSLSVLFQAFSILEKYSLNKFYIIKNKIIIALISLILSYIVFILF